VDSREHAPMLRREQPVCSDPEHRDRFVCEPANRGWILKGRADSESAPVPRVRSIPRRRSPLG
jgi:hypothetical protein